MCQKITILMLIILFGSVATSQDAHHEKSAIPDRLPPKDAHEAVEQNAQGLNASQALERLLEGNKRFVSDLTSKRHKDSKRRQEVSNGQRPIAIVISCSDSRVPPEEVFDVGLGDIFVIRVAGNVLDAVGMGSIEYAASHLNVPLVLVLGHERCGAVTAALSEETPPGHVLAIVEKIHANLAGAKQGPGDPVELAVCSNAQGVSRQIANSAPILKEMVTLGKIKVVAARYDLDDGVVTILP